MQETIRKLEDYKYGLPETEAFCVIDTDESAVRRRGGRIKSADAVYAEGGAPVLLSLTAASLEEERELLLRLAEAAAGARVVYTYNGAAYDLPRLEARFAAHGIASPLKNVKHVDLFKELSGTVRLLGAKSRRLADAAALLPGASELRTDAEKCLALYPLTAFKRLTESAWKIISADFSGGSLDFSLKLLRPLPLPFSRSLPGISFSAENDAAELSISAEGGTARRYYHDFKSYYFLPEEGYAVHKSVAGFIEKERRVQAIPETCFTLFSVTPALLENPDSLRPVVHGALCLLLKDLS